MKSNIIVNDNWLLKHAIKKLNKTENDLIFLLINQNTTKEDVLQFLDTYDIENEKASNTYLLNYLLDRFDITRKDSNTIPRIKGVKEFYRFHNISAINSLGDNVIIYDPDIYLRIIYKDDIRPAVQNKNFIDEKLFKSYFGKVYINNYKKSLKKMSYGNKTFLVPNEAYLMDLIYLNLYLSIIYDRNCFFHTCYVYDAFRYGVNLKPNKIIISFVIRKTVRHFFGKIKRKYIKY